MLVKPFTERLKLEVEIEEQDLDPWKIELESGTGGQSSKVAKVLKKIKMHVYIQEIIYIVLQGMFSFTNISRDFSHFYDANLSHRNIDIYMSIWVNK